MVHNKSGLFYRYLQYFGLFEKKGVNISVVQLKGNIIRRLGYIWKASQADVVIIQRKLLQPWESFLLKTRPCKVIFDFDDAIMFRSSSPYRSIGRAIKFGTIVKCADKVIAGNSYLKNLAESYTDPEKIYILPTPLDLSKYRQKDYSMENDQVTLGWIGSKSTLRYLKELIPVFNKLGERYENVSLKIVANAFLDCDTIEVEKKEWSYEDEVSDLLSFDIGLMPLDDTPWSRGKCSFKLIQYIAVGLPSVCSPVGMNREIIENGENGLWANDLSEWETQLIKLIEDRKLRRKMGLAAYGDAWKYDQSYIFEKFYEIICNTLKLRN